MEDIYNGTSSVSFSLGYVTEPDLNDSSPTVEFMEYDLRSVPYPRPRHSLPWWEITLKVFFYVVIILIALIGNVMVIVVVIRDKRMRTTTNFYIVNLATSDLLVILSCAWVHLVNSLSDNWVLGAFFCKVNSFAQVLSLVASILTLTLIACDRFFGIVFAMKAHIIERRAWYSIVIVWVCSIAVALPMLIYRKMDTRQWADHTETWCDDQWPVFTFVPPGGNSTVRSMPSRTIYYTFVSVVLYFIPITVMTIAYTVIIVKLWSARAPGEQLQTDSTQERVRKRVVIMLVAILFMFILCWLPFHICIMYAEYREQTELAEWFNKFHFFALYLAYSNSAFNPLIYTGFNQKFRKGFKNILVVCKKRKYSDIVTHQESFNSTTLVTKV
ncbi:substance-P receptor-like [Liolophura sinensis]|uniref:substance-P receptor-like n=1 Tax=Liolophura sinensis TaxID=3198878 RepID=UPI00315965AC